MTRALHERLKSPAVLPLRRESLVERGPQHETESHGRDAGGAGVGVPRPALPPTRRLLAVGVRRGGRWRIRTSLWRWLLSFGVGPS